MGELEIRLALAQVSPISTAKTLGKDRSTGHLGIVRQEMNGIGLSQNDSSDNQKLSQRYGCSKRG